MFHATQIVNPSYSAQLVKTIYCNDNNSDKASTSNRGETIRSLLQSIDQVHTVQPCDIRAGCNTEHGDGEVDF